MFVLAPLLFLKLSLYFCRLQIDLFGFSKTTCCKDLYMFHLSMPPRREPPPPPPPMAEALLALMIEYRQATHAESAATMLHCNSWPMLMPTTTTTTMAITMAMVLSQR